MILAIELVKERAARTPWPWQERRGLRIYRHALERGVLLRPLGTTIYFMPPYVIEPEEIDLLARVATEGSRARMRLTRIYVPGELAAGSEIVLPEQAGRASHASAAPRSRRATSRSSTVSGGEYAAVLGARSGKKVRRGVGRHDAVERESPLAITLLQGVARGERMDLIVQKATELGVSRIVPVLAERSVVKVDAKQRERKREHWQSIAISACEQCGRNRVPE